jgi:hypothetical protein
MSVQLVQIKNATYGQYLVAGDVYDGNVYVQADKNRPNAVWAQIPWNEIHTPVIWRFIDLRHGGHLCSSSGFAGYPLNPRVIAVPVYEAYPPNEPRKLDLRAQWTMPVDPKNINAVRLMTSQYNFGADGWIYVNPQTALAEFTTDNNVANADWVVEQLTSTANYSVARLPLSAASPLTYDIDFSTKPQNVSTPFGFDDQTLFHVFENAIGKWVASLNAMGLSTYAQRSANPQVLFRWGKVDNTGEAGVTPNVGDSTPMFERPANSPVVTVTLRNDLDWGGGYYDSRFKRFGAPNAFQYDMRCVVFHEMGHVLGLEHSHDNNSLMRPKLDSGFQPLIDQAICTYDQVRLRARYIDLFFSS